MIRIFFPGLLETGQAGQNLFAIRDGLVNLFVIRGPAGLVCFDTGWSPAHVAFGFTRLGLDVRDVAAVFITHLHWDHARGLPLFRDAEIYVGDHEQPPFHIKNLAAAHRLKRVRDQDLVSAAGLQVRALHTPGHTVGSFSYLAGGHLLFTGDALRLKHDRVVPFLRCFNQNHTEHLLSIRRLAGFTGLDCLATPHSGLTRQPDHAFSAWRDTVHPVPSVGAIAP